MKRNTFIFAFVFLIVFGISSYAKSETNSDDSECSYFADPEQQFIDDLCSTIEEKRKTNFMKSFCRPSFLLDIKKQNSLIPIMYTGNKPDDYRATTLGTYIEKEQKNFDMSNARIGFVTVCTKEGVRIKQLKLTNQLITELPASIQNLKLLSVLNLESNQLTSLPKTMGNLPYLWTLNVSDNELKSLPASMAQLNLGNLHLSHNPIEEFPVFIAEYSNLVRLELASINVKNFENFLKSISKLENLEYLNLEMNKIVALPVEMSNLSSLKTLLVGFNYLTSLPSDFSKLKNLTMFSADGNMLSSFPTFILKLPSIQKVKLRGNQLSSLDEISNWSPNYAVEIDIRDNQIKSNDKKSKKITLINASN